MTLPAHDRPGAGSDDSQVAPRGPRRTGRLWPLVLGKLRIADGRPAGSRFALELFIILCLCGCYYFLARNFAFGVGNNYTNSWVFTACTKSSCHLDALYDPWKGRLSGLLLTGSLFDRLVKDDAYQINYYAMVFGLYQAFWLLVLLLTILVAVRESLLVNLSIFAGLLYNCAPWAGLYFYPWDLPATVFLTLAILLYERGHWALMMAAICVGCYFKETVLVGAVLPLFSRQWKWRWRILSLVGLVGVYLLGKRYLINTLHLQTAVLATGDVSHLKQLLSPGFWIENLRTLFSDKTPPVLLANAGTLVAVLVVGWERRFRPYMWLIVAFVAGHYLWWGAPSEWHGVFLEVRVLTQVLPLSCLVLSEYARGWAGRSADVAELSPGSSPSQPGEAGAKRGGVTQQDRVPVRVEGAWAVQKNDLGLILMAVVVMLISSSAVIRDYYSLLESRQPGYQAHVVSGLSARAERGEPAAQYALGNLYYKGSGMGTNRQEAVLWYRRAAERGHIGAQLALGLCSLRGEGTTQSYEAGVSWFRKVIAQGVQEARCYLGLAYDGGLAVKQGTADHFRYLALLGPLAFAAGALATVVGFVRKRKPVFDPALCIMLVLVVGTLSWQWKYGEITMPWQSTTRDPNYCFAHDKLGYALLQNGQLDEAIAFCRKAVELQPEFADAHNNLGNALLQNGRADEAITHYQEAVKLQPDGTMYHGNLGAALLQKGQLEEAIIHLQRAVELGPDNAIAHVNLGAVLLKKGRVDEALAHYQKVVELQPDNASAHNNLGNALLRKSRLDEALVHYQMAIELRPAFAQAYNNLGYALALKGQLDEAIRQYREALKLKPDFAEANDNLARALGAKKASTNQPTPPTKP